MFYPKAFLIKEMGLYIKTQLNVLSICWLFRSTIEWGFELFNDLQGRLPNLPVFGWLSMKNLTDDGGLGCSKYPDIMDLHYRNKYWQIFEFVDENPDPSLTLYVTFHLYGAYFDNRTLLPNSQSMVRVISMVNSRLGDKNFPTERSNLTCTEISLCLCRTATSGIMTPSLLLSQKWQVLKWWSLMRFESRSFHHFS